MPSTDSADVTWLTQQAYDRLTRERETLEANRPVIAKEIDERRREGDLSENGGYHAAREEQGKQEARIAQLQDMLRRAKVGEVPPDDGIVEPGMVVTVRYDGDDDTESFLLGSREVAETDDVTVYSPQSPIGQAVSGHREGETVQYETPNGLTVKLQIIAAKPYGG